MCMTWMVEEDGWSLDDGDFIVMGMLVDVSMERFPALSVTEHTARCFALFLPLLDSLLR